MGLLDGLAWSGATFTGEWTAGAQPTPVVEPATGRELGTVGIASIDQASAAADAAARAQGQWVKTPCLITHDLFVDIEKVAQDVHANTTIKPILCVAG